MRILITGSSGQIGTNLALRLLDEGHFVFGVDKRINPWNDRFTYLLQYLSTTNPPYDKGIGKETLPLSAMSETMPPDRLPTHSYKALPDIFVPPFHYTHPVTGNPMRVPVRK